MIAAWPPTRSGRRACVTAAGPLLRAQENIYRNFGMPQPNGYRKALRFMRHADHFGFPIITFVDTPGAYAGKNAEELGQVWLLPGCPCRLPHAIVHLALCTGHTP